MKKQDLTPEYIKNHRLSLNLTQIEAARLLNVSKNTWIRMGAGEVPLRRTSVKTIAKVS